MASLTIVEYPNNILEQQCETVTDFDDALKTLIDDMFETMYQADGVGLAAPQVNIGKQVAVVDIGDETGRIELINPVIVEEAGEQVGPEGCLSFPGLFGEVKRSYSIKVKAQDRFGNHFTLKAEDFLARAIQHEIDHLFGVLFTSKVIRYIEKEELER